MAAFSHYSPKELCEYFKARISTLSEEVFSQSVLTRGLAMDLYHTVDSL